MVDFLQLAQISISTHEAPNGWQEKEARLAAQPDVSIFDSGEQILIIFGSKK